MLKNNFKIVIIALLVIALGVGGYIYWKSKTKTSNKPEEKTAEEKLVENAAKGTLPSLETNPLENKPDLNPADKANPFTNIKTNPFK